MSGTSKLFELAAQGQNVSNVDLVSVHLNLGASLDLIDKALHDDDFDKLERYLGFLQTLLAKHKQLHEEVAA